MNKHLAIVMLIMILASVLLAEQTRYDSECVIEVIKHNSSQATQNHIDETPKATASKPDTQSKVLEGTSIAENPFPLNLNTASADELMLLPGIGEVLAERIISLRLQRGQFFSIEELSDVVGIGEKTLDKIRDLIYVNNPKTTKTIETEMPITMDTSTTETETIIQVELNSATYEELCTLPGINGEMADKILALRDTIHYFSNIRELLYVEGFSDNLFVSIMDYIYVEGSN